MVVTLQAKIKSGKIAGWIQTNVRYAADFLPLSIKFSFPGTLRGDLIALKSTYSFPSVTFMYVILRRRVVPSTHGEYVK
jgi:hypothetical protein